MDFSSENEGTWFYFDEDNHDEGRVKIRACPPKETKRIQKLTTSTKKKFKFGQYHEIVSTDESLNDRLYYDYIIEDWENVFYDGEELECTTENKIKIMNVNFSFSYFVGKCLEELIERAEKLRPSEETIVKNS